MNEEKNTYITVIYTDGEKFLNLRRHGRIASIVSLPQSRKDYGEPETLQAVVTLFQTTGLRVDQKEVESLGYFGINDDDFDLDVFLITVPELPPLESLKSVRRINLLGKYKGQSVPAIADYRYTNLSDFGAFTFSQGGAKNAIESVFNLSVVKEEVESES